MDNRQDELKLNPSDSKPAGEATFVPPRHWLGPEELDASYWEDSKIKEKRSQEFFEKPVEWLEKVDQTDRKGLARRDFLTIMGASMAMASFACARRPVHKIIPYVVQPEEVVPGISNWYASTCQECSTNCGVLIKNREGRPIKLEGNPDHPMNKGRLCARGQSSLLSLYDPDRLKNPLKKSRSGGSAQTLSWEEADAEIASHLRKLASGSGKVQVLSGAMSSESTRQLVREFLSGFSHGKHIEFDPLYLEEIAESQGLSYGTEVVPQYRFEQADMVVSLGADFLATWLSPVEHAQGWAKGRKLSSNSGQVKMSKLVCFEPTMTVTGANADERFPVRPGDELKVALAIAHELVLGLKVSSFGSDSQVQSLVRDYSPEKVAHDIGLHGGAEALKKVAHELWENRGRGLVVAGSIASKTAQSLSLQIVANFLNSVLENEGKTVDGVHHIGQPRGSYAALATLIEEMKSGQVDALVIYRSNPLFTLPKSLQFGDALKKVPVVIVVSEQDDETAQIADYVLPDHHYLENWGDASSSKGLYSLQQPAMAPIHSSRAFQDSLLAWIKKGALKSNGFAAAAKDWHEYLRHHWKETLYKQAGAAGSFDQFWEGVLRVGVYQSQASKSGSLSARSFKVASLKQVSTPKESQANSIHLALYQSVAMADGRSANNPWLQELPDPISSVTWDNYLSVSPALGKKLGIANDDVVEVSSGDVTAELPVYIQPGMHPEVVSVAVGYGRRHAGKVGTQAGVDVFPFVVQNGRHLAFSGQKVSLRKTAKFYKLASTQWHTATENRPIINDITLAEYKKNPATAMHTDPHLRLETVPTLWPQHEYKNHRWGMAIDLNSCIGCGACMIACQAENNVPVVGRDQVRVSRQMHWIRIDRYYSGSPENPDVVFQPMLCQHCENASCETVCPVLATVHDDEGLNVQVYNRCVGTRYCQNNCPYKVRRFNFFDHWKSYEGTMNMVWNPDVTVRTRGIMEKCTFCTQRIREAKDKAKDAGEKVRDGDFKTACQQTCPTDAIVFGDMNDPQSRVSKMKESPQAFRVLEVLNNKPSISYMTKVRNKAASAHAKGESHG